MVDCCQVTRLDGFVFGFTSSDVKIVFGGMTYQAGALGFSASSIEDKDNLSVNNLQVVGVLTSEAITDADVRAGRWDGAAVTFIRVNFNDLTQGSIDVHSGTIGNVQTGLISFNAELRGLTQPLSQNIGRIVSDKCDVVLGGPRCMVNLVPFTRTGTVGTTSGPQAFVDVARTEADNWWRGGNITMTSGLSSGQKMEIKASLATGAITLVLPLFFGITVGDTYSMTPGCNHLLKMPNNTYTGDCKIKFNNVINFQGFPEVPGLDRISNVGGRTGNA